MAPQLLIVGAGYTGARLAQSMLSEGWDVSVLSRQPPDVCGSAMIQADLDDPVSLAQQISAQLDSERGLSVAYLVPPVNLKAAEPGPDPRLQALLEALPVSPDRIVLASTSGVYGDHQGREVSESTPVNPGTQRAKNRVRLERTLLEQAEATGESTVILRIAGIYGPGRLPLEAIRDARPIISPAESGPGNRIHVDDLSAAFVAALLHDEPPAIVNVADGDHTTTSEFTLEVARQAGLKAPPVISMQAAQQEFSAMRLSFLNESRQLDVTCLTQRLGVALRYADHRDGITASLASEGKS